MGLSQALSTGISGLVTHQKAMDNVGNNLANVNTVGFKKGIFQFRTLLEQTFRGGMGADGQTGRGSINPISLGLGTQTGSINKVFTQGHLENTSNPNDMAIEGNGFFVLRQGNGFVYTRDGSFYLGADGSLMGSNGLYVQGTMAVKDSSGNIAIPQDAKLQNIIIPIGETGGMVQTSQVAFKGNLNSTQELATGLNLFGGVSYPTVSNIQSWMPSSINGGNPIADASVDTTWSSLGIPASPTYVITQETLDALRAAGITPSINDSKLTVYSGGTAANISTNPAANSESAYYALNTVTGMVEQVWAWDSAAQNYKVPVSNVNLLDGTYGAGTVYIPVVEEIKTVNGGNVQTSAAYLISVPDRLAQGSYTDPNGRKWNITNNFTYPQWFYEATGASMSFEQIVGLGAGAYTDGATVPPNTIDATLRQIWPNGINGVEWPSAPTLLQADSMPRAGETFPASLTTPLEYLQYQKGNTWVRPFANIKDGDEISVTFNKGKAEVAATFIYNRPGATPLSPPQQAIDIERSYTLEHFLTFLAGDVDEPSHVAQRITPAMFGAVIDEEYPEGNPATLIGDNYVAYRDALENVALAQSGINLDNSGGAMGLLSIPPRISANNFGNDSYDAPLESAGAYTRSGVSEIYYERYNPATGNIERQLGQSFNVSFVSNLGAENALSNIRVSYNNVPHEAMYSAETEYATQQGGSAVASMTFYDSLGNPKQATVRLTMVSQDTDFTTWRWYADCTDDTDFPWQVDPNTGEIISNLNVGTGLIRFDKKGNFVKGAEYSESGGITINQVNQGVNEPIVVKLLNGLSSNQAQDLDFSFLTMSATENDFTLKGQNGRPPGTLNSYQVSADGVIQGVYSNGVTAPIARLILALIPNMNGLTAAGNNIFYTGPASGDAQIGFANLGGRGEIRQMQLETSNVDLSEEFTKLISVERGFQANSRTITTADEMLQELLNLKR